MTNQQLFMKTAISLATATHGQTFPNPAVGCVIVKDGRIVGMGAHLKAGEPHAEVMALQQAGEQANGADVYVTLEPCAHYGKTPPCANTLVTHGVRNVYIATTDPNPVVAGKGIAILEQNGITVHTGLCEQEAIELNKDFFLQFSQKRPWITIKVASTLDGKTATETNDSKWITSAESREDGHLLRHRHHAILVGSKTVIHDDPSLTCRLPGGGKHPIRFVVDTHLSIPPDATLLHDDLAPTIIVCGQHANTELEQRFTRAPHVSVWRAPHDEISIGWLVETMHANAITSLLVEGGATVQASFLKEKIVDEIHHYVAPMIIGGQNSVSMIGDLQVERLQDAYHFTVRDLKKIGPDIKITLRRKE